MQYVLLVYSYSVTSMNYCNGVPVQSGIGARNVTIILCVFGVRGRRRTHFGYRVQPLALRLDLGIDNPHDVRLRQ